MGLPADPQVYFDKFKYPLRPREKVFWGSKKKSKQSITFRQEREDLSLDKWEKILQVSNSLARLSLIESILVTGSLSMSNCQQADDLDLMLITKADTLWLTRFLVLSYLWFAGLNRKPGQICAPDKVCVNLLLDTNHLTIDPKPHNLYIAHEVLQAKCVFDRQGAYGAFLRQNAWVQKFIPIAYRNMIHDSRFKKSRPFINPESYILNQLMRFFNLVFFVVQYWYMKPKMTSEQVGLSYAFFHPAKHNP